MATTTDGFELGEPTLVCRWRLAGVHLPLAGRHLRALAARHIAGHPLPPEMLAWVRQHIEWTLASGASDMPDGVLMMVLDTVGRAAMSVGSYAALTACDTTQLMERALQACSEGAQTGVAPETLWAWHADTLIAGYAEDGVLSGSASLVRDLATTRKIEVVLEPNLSKLVDEADEIFLVSDEHGIVPATDRASGQSTYLVDDFTRLFDHVRAS
jgi:hypothetical protein